MKQEQITYTLSSGYKNNDIGGINTLINLIVAAYKEKGYSAEINEMKCDKKNRLYILIGCSNPRIYIFILIMIISIRGGAICWIPCFHSPKYVKNKKNSMLALLYMKSVQFFGVNIGTLSSHEHGILNNGNCNIYSIPFSIAKRMPSFTSKKQYLLVYLGRPVKQKGWFKYLEICKGIKEKCLAIVPWNYEDNLPPNLEIMINLQPKLIAKMLSMASILILPSDYESFGFAQAEALLQGCCVPVFGMWPIWLDVEEMDWRNLTITECLKQINILKAKPDKLSYLHSKQITAWESRNERNYSPLPLANSNRN